MAINGSPRKGGNTEILLTHALEPLEKSGWDKELIQAGATHVFDTINHMYLRSQMIVPGSIYWNLGMGLDKGDVKTDEGGLLNMRNLEETIAWLGNAMKPRLNPVESRVFSPIHIGLF